jgi:hypothetical protein
MRRNCPNPWRHTNAKRSGACMVAYHPYAGEAQPLGGWCRLGAPWQGRRAHRRAAQSAGAGRRSRRARAAGSRPRRAGPRWGCRGARPRSRRCCARAPPMRPARRRRPSVPAPRRPASARQLPVPQSAAHAPQKQNRERSRDDHPLPGRPGWHLRRGGRLEAATRGAARLLVRQPHVLHEARVRRAVALALSAARSHRLPAWLAGGSQLACARRLALCVQQGKGRTRNSTALWPVQGCHWVVIQTPDASCRTGSPRTQPAPQPDCVTDPFRRIRECDPLRAGGPWLPRPCCARARTPGCLRTQAPRKARAHRQHGAAVVHAAPLDGGQLGAVGAVRLAQPQHGLHLRRAVAARRAARATRIAGTGQ